MAIEELGLQRFAGPGGVRVTFGASEYGFIEQRALSMTDVVYAALAQACQLQLLPNVFNLLNTKLRQVLAARHGGALAQLDHQEVGVLQQRIDIHSHCCVFFGSRQVHERSTANSSSFTSAKVLGT